MMPLRRRATPRALLAASALAISMASSLTACGIPTDATPRPIPAKNVPFNLLSPSTATTIAPPSPRAHVPTTVFLVLAGTNRLTTVPRTVNYPGTLTQVIDSLVKGPTNSEAQGGVQTAISAQTVVLGTSVSAGIATINFGKSFNSIAGPELVVAVAQVVFTATALPGVAGVNIEVNGQPVGVPLPNGTLAQGPVNRLAFASLAPH
ncbi:MAG: GerMN domain-containing protein [Actinomycetota bacterium]|nr:GerMN domain-containing protein [Actinomycetota bacterium]